MANLVIDIGNSRTKFAVFNNRELSYSITEDVVTEVLIEQLISDHNITDSIVSSVSKHPAALEDILRKKTSYTRFSADQQKLVQITYRTPHTLGLDRLAGVIAARALYPGQTCLVIDAGTCITYDAVTSEGVYSGGSISPGLNMRFRAMHNFTGRLPMVEADEYFRDWEGYDTETSMISGVQNGLYSEALGFIESYNERYPGLKILICGGDANFFDTRLKSSIFAHSFKTEPHLVLIGLNEVIYQHND